jgi:hypothetical protein
MCAPEALLSSVHQQVLGKGALATGTEVAVGALKGLLSSVHPQVLGKGALAAGTKIAVGAPKGLLSSQVKSSQVKSIKDIWDSVSLEVRPLSTRHSFAQNSHLCGGRMAEAEGAGSPPKKRKRSIKVKFGAYFHRLVNEAYCGGGLERHLSFPHECILSPHTRAHTIWRLLWAASAAPACNRMPSTCLAAVGHTVVLYL